jgi:predicted nucleic acid-binding protein
VSPPAFVIDTNVIIRHRIERLPARGVLSAVVLQEITAGARDDAESRRWGTTARQLEKGNRLLTPDGEDWYQAGRVLNALMRGKRSWRSGRTATISREEQKRLVRDVLIARSARRVNAAVVTYNAGDVHKIRRFCDVTVLEPAEFF